MEINNLIAALEDGKMYSTFELAELSEVSVVTIRSYIRKGNIPKAVYNKKTCVSGANFKKYLEGRL